LVVVAGGAGFLGASLVDRLQAEGDEVVVIDDLSRGHLANLTEARRRGGVRFHRMDVGQGGLPTLAGRIRADAWVHLAMTADPVRAWSAPSADARAVIAGTVELLEAARASGGARVVVASSGAYLFPGQQSGTTSADDQPAPVHPLGAGRLACEAYTRAYSSRGQEVGVLALGSVYGPRQDPLGPGLVARAAWSMLQGRPPRIDGDGRQARDWLFVDDAVDALARAVHTGAGGRLLVGTGTATSVLDVVERLASRIGWTGEPEWAQARPGDPRRSALDARKAAKVLGWQAWTGLDEGLSLTVDWLQARLPANRRYT
jgi:nucleoside-diphosphate-sugar epimerase